MRYIILLSSSFCVWGISSVIRKINELPQITQVVSYKAGFDPRQKDSRAPWFALLPCIVVNLDPDFKCTSAVFYLVTPGKPLKLY